MADDNQNCSSKLKSIHEEVAYQKIEEKSHEFLRKIYPFIRDYQGQLPNLKDIFQPGAIDWLLTESMKSANNGIEAKPLVDFLISTGYKDEPKVDRDGKPLLHRTTALTFAARHWPVPYWNIVIPDLFKIYDRFDVNYIDEAGYTHFHTACKHGFENVVKKFLELGQDPNCIVTETGDSPLLLALTWGSDNLIECLLKNGANPNLANAKGSTPMHIICAEGGNDEAVKKIVEISDELNQPLKFDAQDKLGNTPLHLTVFWCDENSIKFLLRNGADPNLANEEGSTFLHVISQDRHDDYDVLKVFFEVTDDVRQSVQIDARDKLGRTPLQTMADNHQNCSSKSKSMHEEVAYRQIEEQSHEFLRKISNLIIDWEGPLPNLRDIFQPEAIDWILKKSVKEDDHSIVDFVIHTGYKDEPKVDEDGQPILDRITPIHLVHPDEASFTVSKLFQIYDRFDVNYTDEDGLTHFHLACRFNCVDAVKKFLEAGQNPNCFRKDGDSLLHWALNREHKNVAELLLRNGADPTLANENGLTPLHVICASFCDLYCIEMAKMLFEVSDERYQPVQIDARDIKGNTPLHLAIDYYVYKNLVEFLLKNGADPNATNEEGSTPLHIACIECSETFDMLEIFFKTNKELDQLVQLDTRDNSGRTPLQYAVARLLPDVVELLLDHGADLSGFVFPTASHFREHFDPQCENFKLKVASGLLAVVERLESRGYELGRSNAPMIMQFFGEYELFLNNNSASAKCRFEGEQEKEVKKTSLSLYDLRQLRPGEAFVRVDGHWNRLNTPNETFMKLEKLSRKFFRRHALDSFLELTCYELPILCSQEMRVTLDGSSRALQQQQQQCKLGKSTDAYILTPGAKPFTPTSRLVPYSIANGMNEVMSSPEQLDKKVFIDFECNNFKSELKSHPPIRVPRAAAATPITTTAATTTTTTSAATRIYARQCREMYSAELYICSNRNRRFHFVTLHKGMVQLSKVVHPHHPVHVDARLMDVGEQVPSSEPKSCEESQNEIDDFDWTTFNEVPSIEADGELESYMGLDPQLTIHQDVQEDVGEQILTSEPYLCDELQNEIDDFDWTTFNEVPSIEADGELESCMDLNLPLIEHQHVQDDVGEQLLTSEPYLCDELQNEIDDFDWTIFTEVPSTETDCELDSYMDFDLPLIEHQGVQEDVGEQILTTEQNPSEESQNEIDDFDWTKFNEVPSTEADCKLGSYMDFDLPLIEHQDIQEDLGEQVLATEPYLCEELQTKSDDFHQTSFIKVPKTEVSCDQEQNKHHKTGQKKFRKEKKDHKCDECQKTFTRQGSLKIHIKTVHDKRKDYECDVCQKTFSQRGHLKIHVKTVHDKRKNYKCDVCQKTFSHRGHLKIHVKTVHEGQKNFECDLCQKKFSQKNDLKKHIKTVHDEQKGYECDVCQKTFSQRGYLTIHIKTVHDKRKDYECDDCQKTFSQRGHLKIHVKTVHEGRRDYECDVCQKTFIEKGSLKIHVKTVHEGRRDYECDVCQKTFTRKSIMTKHRRIFHDKQKDYECNVCKKKFSWKGSLKIHVKTVHEGQKNFECDLYQKKFSQKNDLKKHIKTVHDEQKGYECDVCQKTFSQRGYLTIHIKTVHDKRKDYECDDCQKTFSQRGHLKIHVKTVHEGRKDYECDVCQKRFTVMNSLKVHIKTVHDKRENYEWIIGNSQVHRYILDNITT
ncbi:unnamed protein product [Trichogramma brassicae]|uniref:C2H2-type domain-containing protein n=1 Tax=Trichogramma brassicae TaxID=86971 RepID=A0A6H5IDJ3_9HYME|nr:unnamed protein product [Trichogramma brassicae]